MDREFSCQNIETSAELKTDRFQCLVLPLAAEFEDDGAEVLSSGAQNDLGHTTAARVQNLMGPFFGRRKTKKKTTVSKQKSDFFQVQSLLRNLKSHNSNLVEFLFEQLGGLLHAAIDDANHVGVKVARNDLRHTATKIKCTTAKN